MTAKLPDISLIELSELILHITPGEILKRLAARGCFVKCSDTQWKPLSGGREYTYCTATPVMIEGVKSTLTVEISRMREDPSQSWVDGLDIRPGNLDNAEWTEKIRNILSLNFEPPSVDKDGVEIYQRGSIEQSILFPGSTSGPAHLSVHRRSPVHQARRS